MDCDLPVMRGVLSSLGQLNEARAVALWVVDGDGVRLLVDWQLDQPSINVFRRDWHTCAPLLRRRERVGLGDDTLLVPLLSEDGTLRAVLHYVSVPLPVGEDLELLERVSASVRRLLLTELPRAARGGPTLPVLLGLDMQDEPDSFGRRAYAAMLERCGGSMTLAATLLGTGRTMLYDRVQAFGLRLGDGDDLDPAADTPSY